MLTDKGVPADDHAAEVDALNRRYPRWTIWFGLFTGRWWALPPREQDVGDFLEAETPQKLIARIEVIQYTVRRAPAAPAPAPAARVARAAPAPARPEDRTLTAPRPVSRQDARRPSNLLRLEGVTPPPPRRVPVVAWPGSTAR